MQIANFMCLRRRAIKKNHYSQRVPVVGYNGRKQCLGVQRRLIQVNCKAQFVPCSNHSLNLAAVHAVSSNSNSVTFFQNS